MPDRIDFQWHSGQLRALRGALSGRAIRSALRKAGSTAVRDMRAEAVKRVRARKRIKARAVRKALLIRRPRGSDLASMEWGLDVRGDVVKLADYPHRQTRRGVSVAVNKGKRTLVRGAFIATMRTGHKGVFVRRGASRLPIRELLGSRPADALLHEGEAEGVLERGRTAFAKTFERVLEAELAKGKG